MIKFYQYSIVQDDMMVLSGGGRKMRCSWKRFLVCFLLGCFAVSAFAAQAETYHNQAEYEAVMRLVEEGYFRFAYQMNEKEAMLMNSQWSYDLDTGYFTLERTERKGFVMKVRNGWPETYIMTWGWGTMPLEALAKDEFISKRLVWMYKLDGTGVLGEGAVPFSGGRAFSATSTASEVHNLPVVPLGDESLPIPALCAMAGVALAAAFLFHRRQKALQV